MLNREKQFRNSFFFIKRSAKSPTLPSYTYGYTAGLADKEPAVYVYNYILEMQTNKSSFEEKIASLEIYLHQRNKEEEQKEYKNTGFNNMILQLIKRAKEDINNGVPVQTKRA